MKILGVKIDNLSLDEILHKIEVFLNDNKQHYITTSNPEFIVKAQKDKEFKDIINNADLNVPDGFGLVLASLLLGKKIKQRITGVDLMELICKKASYNNWPVFLFGAGPGVAKKTADSLRERYKNLEISEIDENKKDFPNKSILFVALGAPKQEKWINNNLKNMPNIKLAMGVGGSFDFISGDIKRAPKFMRNLGLEWFWRLIIQPWRIRRILNAVIIFPFLILKRKLK